MSQVSPDTMSVARSLEIVKCDPEFFLRRISPQIDRRSRLR